MKSRPVQLLIAIIVLAPVVFFVMINLHEVGHTIVARLFGDQDAGYYVYRDLGRGQSCLGCNFYDATRLSSVGNLTVTIGGLLVSQSVVLLLVWARRRRMWAKLYGYPLATAIIVFASDIPFQVAQGVHGDVANQTRLSQVDLVDFLYLLHTDFDVPVDAAKLSLLVFALGYCLLLVAWTRIRPEVVP